MNRKQQLLQEFKLRRLIKKAIKLKHLKRLNEKKEELNEEQQLRHIIQHLLREGDVDSDTKPAPFASTPVNALADAFNQILPILKAGLRKLAKEEERVSYRAHVLEKFKSIFGNFEGLDSQPEVAIGESSMTEAPGDIDELTINIDDDDRIMPSDGKEDERFKEPEKDPEKESEEEFDSFKMAGANPTGARVAFETINDSNIEQVLSDKRRVLFDPEYKEEFKKYALYNVDLWLLTYEKELADSLGQQPAFSETVTEKPSGAQIQGAAAEFEGGGDLEGLEGLEDLDDFGDAEGEEGIPTLGEHGDVSEENQFVEDLEETLMSGMYDVGE
jgi:hypothetical protein